MSSSFEELYNRLNSDQKKAVDTIDGPVLVIAGPGTGKTQVLALRIANILRQTDVTPSSILCLTFQDASVLAMKNRLQSFIGNDAFKVQIHTFHSFCSEIIRSFPHEFDFSGDVEAIKEIDKLGIFKEILVDNKLTSLQQRNDVLGNFKTIVSAISNLKKEFVTPDKLLQLLQAYESTLEPKEKKMQQRRLEKMLDLQKFYVKYLELMQEKNLIDFDDMIFKVTETFSRNDELVKYFQEQYLYTLVDEFQDTNSAQLEVIKSVGNFEGLEANVFAVGDDDQTIFRFQGASSNNFEKFLNIFPDTGIIVLHTNYRSTQEIVDAGTNVIKNNPARVSDLEYFKSKGLNKDFKSESVSSSSPQIHEFEHSFHEDFWVGEKIKELVANGTSLNEIAIITRINRQIVNITKFLDKFKIPYLIRRSESILDNKYIQNLIQIFEIISDPLALKNDKVMWQVLSQDFLGLSSFDVFALVHDAKEDKSCMYDFVMKTHLPKYEGIYQFILTIIALQQYSLNNSFLNTFTKVIHTLNIIKFLEKLPESYAQINRLSSLFQFASTRLKYSKDYSIQKFIEETKLMREKNIVLASDPIDINAENKINILTAHSSKGLEFDYVFIYQGVENKWEKYRGASDALILPPLSLLDENDSASSGSKVKETEAQAEEIDERRLFYVAMTRAKKGLFITLSKHYFDSDSGEVDVTEKIKSKFVAESDIKEDMHHPEFVPRHGEIMGIILTEDEPITIPDKNKDYLKSIVDRNLKLSASRLNKYDNCQYRFLLEDIYQLPVSKSLSAEIGIAVHKGIEMLVKSYSKEEGFYPLEKITEIAIGEFNKNIDKDIIGTEELGSIDVAYEEIKRGLSAYYDYFALNPDKPEISEFMSFAVFNGISLVGRIDKISSLSPSSFEKNSLVITDYKTTSRFPSITEFLGLTKNSDKNHLRQLLFYRLLLESSDNLKAIKNKQISSLRIEYINTKDGEVKVFELPTHGIYEFNPRANSKKTAEFDIDAEYEKLKEDLKKTFQSIRNLDFERTSDRKQCQTCPFKNHCGR